jgi:hypothetical protein
MAVTIWTGGAVGIAQVDTVTISGTWTAADTVTLTINGNDLVVTVDTPTATASVASALSAAVNASGKTDGLAGTETRNLGGQQIPEFTEVEASVSGSVVTIEAKTRGIPFTMTDDSSTASTGTTAQTTATAATGPNHYDNAENWSTGAVPVSSDAIIFQQNEIDCLYGLSQSAVTNVTMQIDASYTGNIGLPTRNENGYEEYRPRHLDINFSNAERSVVIGEGPGGGSSRINIDADTSDPKVVIWLTGPAEANAKGAIDFIGGNTATDISIRRGSLSLATDSDKSATVRELEVTYDVQRTADAEVTIGEAVTLSELNKDGGTVTFINAPASLTLATVTNRSGLVEINGQCQATLIAAEGGDVRWHSTGTCAALTLSGSGVFDVSRDLRPKIVSAIDRYSDESRLIDPNKTIGSLVIDNNNVTDLSNLDIGRDIRITRGTPA